MVSPLQRKTSAPDAPRTPSHHATGATRQRLERGRERTEQLRGHNGPTRRALDSTARLRLKPHHGLGRREGSAHTLPSLL